MRPPGRSARQAASTTGLGLGYVMEDAHRDHEVEPFGRDLVATEAQAADAVSVPAGVGHEHVERFRGLDGRYVSGSGGHQHLHDPAGAAADVGDTAARDVLRSEQGPEYVPEELQRAVVAGVVGVPPPLVTEVGHRPLLHSRHGFCECFIRRVSRLGRTQWNVAALDGAARHGAGGRDSGRAPGARRTTPSVPRPPSRRSGRPGARARPGARHRHPARRSRGAQAPRAAPRPSRAADPAATGAPGC